MVIINKIFYCSIYLTVYIIVSMMHGHINIKFFLKKYLEQSLFVLTIACFM